jgi:hypothetical protein
MHEISNTQAPDPNNTQFPNSNNENIVWLLGDSNYVENSFPNPSNPTLLKGGREIIYLIFVLQIEHIDLEFNIKVSPSFSFSLVTAGAHDRGG